jgi:putative transcriptional regulator
MISYHPTYAQLKSYVAGTLPVNTALIIASHIDLCERCQDICRVLEQEMARTEIEETQVAPLPASFDGMMESILSGPEDVPVISSESQINPTIELDGKPFDIPRALQRLVPVQPNWSKLAGRVWLAPVSVTEDENIHFIYMEKGAQVPEHTHRGVEHSLVLEGGFSDELGDYLTGDFTTLSHAHKHRPVTQEDEGCLVLSVVDQPLHFTSGLARLLNPFSHLFFK